MVTRLSHTVVVHNEVTGEMTTVVVSSFSDQDAQRAALVTVFKRYGWRKAVAFPPNDDSRFEPPSADAIS